MNDIKIPTEREIAEVEAHLANLKKIREQARKGELLAAMKDKSFIDSLSTAERMTLMRALQEGLSQGHKKRRGAPVAGDLKSDLIDAINAGDYTLGQLSRMFNLSVSYISRTKKEMREETERNQSPVQNAYQDKPLKHSVPFVLQPSAMPA